MAVSEDKKAFLDQLRRDLIKRTGPEVEELDKITDEIDLTGISAEDLESLCNPQFTLGINFKEIDTSGRNSLDGKFTSFDMNTIAPGAINEAELKAKLTPQSLLKARVVDLVDSQSGLIATTQELFTNADVEDLIELKVKSQGTNMQMVNRARNINEQAVDGKPIKSRFLEE
jgi:hypothetical protein